MHALNRAHAIWPVFLKRVEQAVAAHVGSGRVYGNAQPACFGRQISVWRGTWAAGLCNKVVIFRIVATTHPCFADSSSS